MSVRATNISLLPPAYLAAKEKYFLPVPYVVDRYTYLSSAQLSSAQLSSSLFLMCTIVKKTCKEIILLYGRGSFYLLRTQLNHVENDRRKRHNFLICNKVREER